MMIDIFRASLISGLAQLELQSPSYQPVIHNSILMYLNWTKLNLSEIVILAIAIRDTVLKKIRGKVGIFTTWPS